LVAWRIDCPYEELARKFPQGLAGLPELPEELSGAVLKTIQNEREIETAQAGRYLLFPITVCPQK
jgi:hypothetical protein